MLAPAALCRLISIMTNTLDKVTENEGLRMLLSKAEARQGGLAFFRCMQYMPPDGKLRAAPPAHTSGSSRAATSSLGTHQRFTTAGCNCCLSVAAGN